MNKPERKLFSTYNKMEFFHYVDDLEAYVSHLEGLVRKIRTCQHDSSKISDDGENWECSNCGVILSD